MSSSSAPEDALEALPSYENFDGGSSKKLTQGEIILVTVLSFVVVVTAFVISYIIYVRRARKWRPIMESKAEPRSSSNGQLAAKEIPLAIDCETAAGGGGGRGGGTTTDRLRTTDDTAEDGGPSHNQDDGNRQSRRRSHNQNDGDRQSRRRSSNCSDRSERRRSSNASDASNSRKSSVNSTGSNVSSHYKLAAIEHMNQISQAGR